MDDLISELRLLNFYVKSIDSKYGKFPCENFSCPGCDDWLDCEPNTNRKFDIKSDKKLVSQWLLRKRQ